MVQYGHADIAAALIDAKAHIDAEAYYQSLAKAGYRTVSAQTGEVKVPLPFAAFAAVEFVLARIRAHKTRAFWPFSTGAVALAHPLHRLHPARDLSCVLTPEHHGRAGMAPSCCISLLVKTTSQWPSGASQSTRSKEIHPRRV